jgi:hypothetical protein
MHPALSCYPHAGSQQQGFALTQGIGMRGARLLPGKELSRFQTCHYGGCFLTTPTVGLSMRVGGTGVPLGCRLCAARDGDGAVLTKLRALGFTGVFCMCTQSACG